MPNILGIYLHLQHMSCLGESFFESEWNWIQKKKEKVENLLYQQTLMSVCLQCSVGRLGVSLFLFPCLFSKQPFLTYLSYAPCFSVLNLCSQVRRKTFPIHSFLEGHLVWILCNVRYLKAAVWSRWTPGGGGGGGSEKLFSYLYKSFVFNS